MVKLIVPNEKYLKSYLDGCKETWGKCHDNYIIHDPNLFDDWSKHIFKDYENQANGINLPDGFVPSKTFWIISNNEYIGTINIRLKLNQKLSIYGGHIGLVIRASQRGKKFATRVVPVTIEMAKEFNINPILVTVQASNNVSYKLFENAPYIRKEEEIIELYGKQQLIYRYYF